MMKLQSKEQLMGVHVKAAKNALSIKIKQSRYVGKHKYWSKHEKEKTIKPVKMYKIISIH